MNYNDSQIMSDDTYIRCQSAYEKLSANNIHDLREILEKLESQKKAIISANLPSNNSQILDGINESILGLKNILHSTTYTTQKSNSPSSKQGLKFTQSISTPNVDTPPYTYSENRSDSISEYMGGKVPNLPDYNTPNNPPFITPESPQNIVPESNLSDTSQSPTNVTVPSDNIAPNNRTENRARISSRSCPQQGSIIAKLLSQFKVNSGAKVSYINRTAKEPSTGHTAHSIHSEILHKNSDSISTYNYPYHKPNYEHNLKSNHYSKSSHHCSPEQDILSRQIDIVRLLILYLQLRPTYPYCYRICSITSTQFDILSSLINI